MMLLNPPYGERIAVAGVAGARAGGSAGAGAGARAHVPRFGAREAAHTDDGGGDFFARLASHWKHHYPGWTAWLLTPDLCCRPGCGSRKAAACPCGTVRSNAGCSASTWYAARCAPGPQPLASRPRTRPPPRRPPRRRTHERAEPAGARHQHRTGPAAVRRPRRAAAGARARSRCAPLARHRGHARRVPPRARLPADRPALRVLRAGCGAAHGALRCAQPPCGRRPARPGGLPRRRRPEVHRPRCSPTAPCCSAKTAPCWPRRRRLAAHGVVAARDYTSLLPEAAASIPPPLPQEAPHDRHPRHPSCAAGRRAAPEDFDTLDEILDELRTRNEDIRSGSSARAFSPRSPAHAAPCPPPRRCRCCWASRPSPGPRVPPSSAPLPTPRRPRASSSFSNGVSRRSRPRCRPRWKPRRPARLRPGGAGPARHGRRAARGRAHRLRAGSRRRRAALVRADLGRGLPLRRGELA